jgi:hypothetical protein
LRGIGKKVEEEISYIITSCPSKEKALIIFFLIKKKALIIVGSLLEQVIRFRDSIL